MSSIKGEILDNGGCGKCPKLQGVHVTIANCLQGSFFTFKFLSLAAIFVVLYHYVPEKNV